MFLPISVHGHTSVTNCTAISLLTSVRSVHVLYHHSSRPCYVCGDTTRSMTPHAAWHYTQHDTTRSTWAALILTHIPLSVFYILTYIVSHIFKIQYFVIVHQLGWGMQWRSCLRHCTTSRKAAGSIPDGATGILHWHNRSGCTMALGLTQPLTEMSTGNVSWW